VSVLLLQTTKLAEKALRVDPYSGAAYGALVFVLGAISYLIWKKNRKLEQRHYDHLQKMLGLMQMVESKMEMFTPMRNDIKDVNRTLDKVQQEIEDLQDEISN